MPESTKFSFFPVVCDGYESVSLGESGVRELSTVCFRVTSDGRYSFETSIFLNLSKPKEVAPRPHK